MTFPPGAVDDREEVAVEFAGDVDHGLSVALILSQIWLKYDAAPGFFHTRLVAGPRHHEPGGVLDRGAGGGVWGVGCVPRRRMSESPRN